MTEPPQHFLPGKNCQHKSACLVARVCGIPDSMQNVVSCSLLDFFWGRFTESPWWQSNCLIHKCYSHNQYLAHQHTSVFVDWKNEHVIREWKILYSLHVSLFSAHSLWLHYSTISMYFLAQWKFLSFLNLGTGVLPLYGYLLLALRTVWILLDAWTLRKSEA